MPAEIDCVAVTDYNSGDWIDRLQRLPFGTVGRKSTFIENRIKGSAKNEIFV